MMVNDKSRKEVYYGKAEDRQYVKEKVDSLPKLPNILLRNYNKTTQYGSTKPLERSLHLAEMSRIGDGHPGNNPNCEIQRAYYGDKDTAGRCYQFNSLYQLYSPEILFNSSISVNEGMQLRIKI